jgi:hypothetical protein
LERIRPAHIPQEEWEDTFAWPADNRPPYPTLTHQWLYGSLMYPIVAAVIGTALQLFTPFPVLTWLARLAR